MTAPPRCERCNLLEEQCVCPLPEPETLDPAKQTAKLSLEKRKKGKLVTVVGGLPATGNDLPALLTKLKNHCGAGGSLTGNELEIQGDQLVRVEAFLKGQGYRVKVAGRGR